MRIVYFLMVLSGLVACSQQNSADNITSAKQHIINLNYDAASIELKNAIKKSPELAEARYLLGKTYLQLGNYQSAEKELNKAISLKYSASEVLPLLLESYKKMGAVTDLLKLNHKQQGITAALAAEIAFNKLQAYVRLENEHEAKKLIEEIKADRTKSLFKNLSLVLSYVIENNIEVALLMLDKIITTNPNQPDALKLKASLLLQDKKITLATNVYRQYYEFYPEDLEIAFHLSRLLTNLNKTDEAEPIVDSLLKNYPENMLLNQLKGIARFNAGDNIKALMFTEKAISANLPAPELRLIAGYSAYLLEDYESSHHHLSIVVGQLPSSHMGLRLLAIVQLNLGLNEAASTTLEQLDNISSDDASLFSSVGIALAQSGKTVKAKQMLNKSINNSNSAESIAKLGVLQLTLNDMSGITNLERSLEQAPNIQATKVTLATAYLTTGQTEKALALASNWKEENTQDIAAYKLAGAVYYQLKKYEAARIEFEQALVIDPNNNQTKVSLIDIFLQLDENSQAKLALNNLLDTDPAYTPALAKLYVIAKKSGNPTAIINRIAELVRTGPKNKELTLLFSKIQLTEKNFAKAISLLEVWTDTSQAPSSYWAILGESYLKAKKLSKARLHYKQWLIAEPNNRNAIIGSLNILDLRREYGKAIELSLNYLRQQENDTYIQLLHSHFLIMNNNYAAAKESYKKLSDEIKELPMSKGLLGKLQLNDTNYQAALPNLLAAYQALPNAQNTHLVAMCYAMLGQHQLSYNFLLAQVKKYPEDLTSLMLLANQQINNNPRQAINSYEMAITLKADNVLALNNLAYLYFKQGKIEKGQALVERALSIEPNNGNALDTLAQILMAQQDHQGALKYLTRAVSNNQVDEEVYLNYIEALLFTEKRELALRKIAQHKLLLKPSQLKLEELKVRFKL